MPAKVNSKKKNVKRDLKRNSRMKREEYLTGHKQRKSADDESDEDEDDLLPRTGNFISTSTSLPRGILKVRVVEIGPIQLLTCEIHPAS